ncbi:unnamed protein product [Mytilus edulis]|uniref:Uncharacterized protein n=1 Tax=Mytilus edulis TaxID=6550 RepID=A0A8S3RC31_MYTED|nr:unnamed protein product [Mytilus edulis]
MEKNVKLETICAIDEHTLWALGDATVFYITLGEDLKVKRVYNADRIFEISYSKAGFLYLTQNGEIGRINSKGKYEKFADESPLGCCGIYAYDSGDIVVGVIENETDAEPFHKIVMYNKNGELTNSFQYNIFDTPDFIDALPQQITVNPLNGDIIIIDWNCEVSTRVVGLSKTGNIHWMFHGPFDEPDEIFCPDAIACADSGHVLILTDKTLLVLSQDGNLAYKKPINLESIDCITNIVKDLFFVACDGCKIHKLSITYYLIKGRGFRKTTSPIPFLKKEATRHVEEFFGTPEDNTKDIHVFEIASKHDASKHCNYCGTCLGQLVLGSNDGCYRLG